MFLKRGVLKIIEKFTGKHLCWSFFKKRLQHRGCYVKFAKILRKPFSTEHLLVVASETVKAVVRNFSNEKAVLKYSGKFPGAHLCWSTAFLKLHL